jgi:hypothetical protein
LVYKGAEHEFVRGYVGDWLIVQLIYVLLRLWIAFNYRYRLAGVVMIIAFVVELVQYATAGMIPRTTVTELTIGSTFDPGDLVAYTFGLATVLLIDSRFSTAQTIS